MRTSSRLTLVAALLTAVLWARQASPAPAPRPGASLAFIEDDWPRALAEARAKDLPLFVDAWAPW